ncbi:MAG: lytic transglycosylase domain-containing protein [Limnochordales bacterium]|nr:lytic transglycosylase domain-containing protein [Limnochordales bacterium]
MKGRTWWSRLLSVVLLLLVSAGIWVGGLRILYHLYPLTYAEVVDRYAREYSIDPFLIMAMIRVESSFKPQSISPRGAVGLMQVMPATAQDMAARIGIEEFDPEHDLLEPETNIRIGVCYLADLVREFGPRTAVVLAAYNAGRGTVRRWLEQEIWDGDPGGLARVPYDETRRYVARVLTTVRWYYRIYRGRWPRGEIKSELRAQWHPGLPTLAR